MKKAQVSSVGTNTWCVECNSLSAFQLKIHPRRRYALQATNTGERDNSNPFTHNPPFLCASGPLLISNTSRAVEIWPWWIHLTMQEFASRRLNQETKNLTVSYGWRRVFRSWYFSRPLAAATLWLIGHFRKGINCPDHFLFIQNYVNSISHITALNGTFSAIANLRCSR